MGRLIFCKKKTKMDSKRKELDGTDSQYANFGTQSTPEEKMEELTQDLEELSQETLRQTDDSNAFSLDPPTVSSLSQPEVTGALVRTGSRFISEDDLRTRQDKSEANRQSLAIQHAILSDCATLIHSNGKSDFNVQ